MKIAHISDKHLKAIKLRKQKKSYREIAKELGVSKGTVSYWFRDLNWSKNIKKQLNERNKKISLQRLKHLNNLKKVKYEKLYQQAEQEGRSDFIKYKDDRLFVLGVVVYWGEGDKVFKNGIIKVANIDPRMLRIFKDFLLKFCKVDKQKIKGYILLYPELSKEICLRYWSKNTGLAIKAFYKPSVITGRHKKKKLDYGVCTIGVNDKYLKKKILTWIDLLSEEY